MKKKMPRRTMISLGALHWEAQQAPDAVDLDPQDYVRSLLWIIIEYANGQLTIVDGYHRASGMVNFAEGTGSNLDGIMVPVIDATGYTENVVAAAAVPTGGFGLSQEEAIEKIVKASR